MKKTVVLFRCLQSVIRKKFFKGLRYDKSHECVVLKEMIAETASKEEIEHQEEYTYSYGMTTRWQTL